MPLSGQERRPYQQSAEMALAGIRRSHAVEVTTPPGKAIPIFNMALIHRERRNTTLARQGFERAIELFPQHGQ